MVAEKLAVYRGCTPVVDAYHHADGPDSIVVTVIEAIAEAAGVDATDLPPLYDTVNILAIEAMVSDWGGGSSADMYLSFSVDTWNVFVSADGRVRVCDASVPTEEPEPIFT